MSVYVDHYAENLNDLIDEEKSDEAHELEKESDANLNDLTDDEEPDEAHEVEKEYATNDEELVVYPHVEGDEYDTSKEIW
ncbi:hypothetical protein L1887_31594 [Cichorium endivia]|nr:hypothetical protein L1887_31594 [Cichorium endivia]